MTDAFAEDQLDELLRALAHADRRRFLRECLFDAVSAGELAAMTDLAPASVSEHLKVLRKTGLLVLEQQGRFRYYRTNRGLLRQTAKLVKALDRSARGQMHGS